MNSFMLLRCTNSLDDDGRFVGEYVLPFAEADARHIVYVLLGCSPR